MPLELLNHTRLMNNYWRIRQLNNISMQIQLHDPLLAAVGCVKSRLEERADACIADFVQECRNDHID